MAFNLGSAIGAYFGGMMITLGFSWSYVTLPAAILSFSAMTSLLMYGYLCASVRPTQERWPDSTCCPLVAGAGVDYTNFASGSAAAKQPLCLLLAGKSVRW